MRSQEADKQVNLWQHGVIETDVSKALRGGDEKTFVSAVMERQRWRGLEEEAM